MVNWNVSSVLCWQLVQYVNKNCGRSSQTEIYLKTNDKEATTKQTPKPEKERGCHRRSKGCIQVERMWNTRSMNE